MKTELVNKTLAQVTEYNTLNAKVIAAGLIAPQAQSEKAIADEVKHGKDEARRLMMKINVLRKIWQALPIEVRALFTEPVSPATVHTCYNSTRLMSQCYTVATPELGRYLKNSAWPTSDGGYYRVVVGDYGNKSIIKLNDAITIDEKQISKVVAAIIEKHGQQTARDSARSESEKASARAKAFAEANPTFMKYAGVEYCTTGFAVAVDGRVTMGYKTFTVAQWEQILAMRTEQKAALAALEASFK